AVTVTGDDALEMGKETTYEVRVTNPGSSPATNVQVQVALADGLLPRSAKGASRFRVEGQTVLFEPVQALAAQGQLVYRISALGHAGGDRRVRVSVSSDQVRTPLTREMRTQVY